MLWKHAILASSAVLAAAIGTSAQAQSHAVALAAAAAAVPNNTIEELVVTAEKRAQSLQDVPVAISAYTSEKRDLLGINSVQDMTNFTPGLNYSSQLDRTSLRGVGRLTNEHPIATAVAVYDDGIFTTSTVTAGKTPIFTDRVEVLRGPQGTLYGRNSIGGAINIISRRPTEDFYAEVRATVANYGRTLLEAAVSGPLAPDLQFRLAGSWEKQRDGYFKNIVPGMPSEGNVIDQYYVEGQLQAKLGERLDGWAKLSVSGWNNGGGGPGARAGYSAGPFRYDEFGLQNVNAYFACAPGSMVTNVVNTSPLGCTNPAINNPREFASNIRQSVSLDETYTFATQWTYRMDGADLKYIGGGQNYHYTLIQDNGPSGSISSFQLPVDSFIPGVPVAAQPCPATNAAHPGACAGLTVFPPQSSTYQEDYHNYSHELDLASSGDGALQWLAGLYYYREGYRQPVFTTMPNQPQLAGPILGVTGAPAAPDFQHRLYDDRTQFEEESYAGFGQVDWKFTDTLKATLGLRWSHDHEYGTEAVRVVCFATTPCGITPELYGSFAPPIDVTQGVVFTGTPLPQGTSAVTFTPDGFANRTYDASWQATTGTAGIQWDPNRDTMVYARYSRGYKQGGFASGVTSTLGQFPYTAPEHINDYEVGLKKDFGRRLQTNLALFYYDYSDLQAPLTVANNTGGLAPSQSQFVNVPKSISAGVELEATWTPIDNLEILFNYSYNDAHVTRLSGIIDPNDPEALQPGAKPLSALQSCTGTNTKVAGGNALCDVSTGLVQRPQDLSGNSLPQAAKNKIAVNVLYTWDFEKGSLTPSVSYTWRDKEYNSIFERDYDAAPSWDQVDARITWKDKDNKYSVIAYVKNAFDSLGYDGAAAGTRNNGVFPAGVVAASGGAVTPGLPGAAPGQVNGVITGYGPGGITRNYDLTPPRTFGVEFQYRF